MKDLYEYHPITKERVEAIETQISRDEIIFGTSGYAKKIKNSVLYIRLLKDGELFGEEENHQQEMEKCRNDVGYFLENYCTLQGKPIFLRGYQKNFLKTWQNSKLKKDDS